MFEIQSNDKLRLIKGYMSNNLKLEKHTRTSEWEDTFKLPKLETVKFDGDPRRCQPFIDSFNAAIESSSALCGI